MTRQIVVVANCQGGGLSAALQRIFWADEVSAVPMTLFTQPRRPGLRAVLAPQARRQSEQVERVQQADLVFGTRPVHAQLQASGKLPANFVTVPSLFFSAFHPDVVQARDTGSGRNFAYNSALCVWAWNHQLSPAEALRLFSRKTMQALGYFDRWHASVEAMRATFDAAGLEFDRFYLAVKREGCFMHTMNHPRAVTLAWLAKSLALRAGHDRAIWNRPIDIPDALGGVESWPVYPDVARELALPGSYGWLVGRGTLIDGLEHYIEHAYRTYTEAGVQPGALEIHGRRPDAADAVLTRALQGA